LIYTGFFERRTLTKTIRGKIVKIRIKPGFFAKKIFAQMLNYFNESFLIKKGGNL